MVENNIDQLIELGLAEDVREGDHSALACIPDGIVNKGVIFAKEDGILFGLDIALKVFQKVDPNLELVCNKKDGDLLKKGDVILQIKGNPQSILTGERLALNFLQRLSGIASTTQRLVEICQGRCTLLDTRKTTPGYRVLEKAAVKAGGGENHRMGLFDMIMLKDNHIDYSGGITAAIQRCKEYLSAQKLDLKIEVEVRDFDELEEVLSNTGVHRVMLDNFTPEMLKKAVKLIGGRLETEASGGITESTLADFSKTGVNFISVGALTHSVKSMDFSLLVHAE
ncbi:MAG: nicotinate-nucleotide pyrophosphorylase (carboxylating) [Sphingobacteriales bacterium]|jgi:nicotinate-nucleotide pyrophosphorylase (carboxylating)